MTEQPTTAAEHEQHRGKHTDYACGFSGPHCWACNEPWPCRASRGIAIEAEARQQDGSAPAVVERIRADVHDYMEQANTFAGELKIDRDDFDTIVDDALAALPPSAPPADSVEVQRMRGTLALIAEGRGPAQQMAQAVLNGLTEPPDAREEGDPFGDYIGIVQDPPSAPPALDVDRLALALRRMGFIEANTQEAHYDRGDFFADDIIAELTRLQEIAEYARLQVDR